MTNATRAVLVMSPIPGIERRRGTTGVCSASASMSRSAWRIRFVRDSISSHAAAIVDRRESGMPESASATRHRTWGITFSMPMGITMPSSRSRARRVFTLDRARGDPPGPEAVHRAQDLLRQRPHRNRSDVRVPVGLEDPLRVGAIGLVPGHVRAYVVRWEQDHLVTQALDLTPPVVRRAARLYHDRGARRLREEHQELPTREPSLTSHPAGLF